MIGIGVGVGFGVFLPGPVYDADAVTLFARMTPEPDAARKSAISTLIAALRTAGAWSKLDLFRVLAAHSEQAALLNWKSTSFTATKVATPTFTTDVGFATNGVDNAIDWGMAPSGGTQFTQDSAMFGVWEGGENNIVSANHGTGTDASVQLYHATAAGAFRVRVNAVASSNSGTPASTIGFQAVTRPSAALQRAWKDGVQVGGDFAVASAARSAVNFNSGRVNSAFSVSNPRVQMAGADMSGAEMLAINAALVAHFGAL